MNNPSHRPTPPGPLQAPANKPANPARPALTVQGGPVLLRKSNAAPSPEAQPGKPSWGALAWLRHKLVSFFDHRRPDPAGQIPKTPKDEVRAVPQVSIVADPPPVVKPPAPKMEAPAELKLPMNLKWFTEGEELEWIPDPSKANKPDSEKDPNVSKH